MPDSNKTEGYSSSTGEKANWYGQQICVNLLCRLAQSQKLEGACIYDKARC